MVEVTQQDRDAAAPVMRHMYVEPDDTEEALEEFKQAALTGQYDDHYIVQAFAKRAERAEVQTIAEIVAWLERWGSENDRLIAAAGGKPHREAIAAIRSVLKLAIVGIKGGAYK